MNILQHKTINHRLMLLVAGCLLFSSNTYGMSTLKNLIFPSNLPSTPSNMPSMPSINPGVSIQQALPLEVIQDKAQPIIMKVVDYIQAPKQMQGSSFFTRYIWNDRVKKWAVPVGIGCLVTASGYFYLRLRRERSSLRHECNALQRELTAVRNERYTLHVERETSRGRENNLQATLNQINANLSAAQNQITASQKREQEFRQQAIHGEQAALRLAFGQIIKDPHFTASLNQEDFQFFNSLQLETGQHFWHRAAELGDESALWVIAGVPPCRSDEENDITSPLFKALIENKVKLAMQLLQLGANPNEPNKHGVHPLHIAVLLKNRAFINLLLAKKANVNVKTTTGITPLYIASFFNDISIRDLLLKAEADVIPALSLLQEQRNFITYNRLCDIRFQDETTCSICTETMNQSNKRIVSCCSAIYCNDCLSELKISRPNNTSCPNCRATSFTTISISETNLAAPSQSPAASSSTEHIPIQIQAPIAMHLNDQLLMNPDAFGERFNTDYMQCANALEAGNLDSIKPIVEMYQAVAHTSERAKEYAHMLRSLYEYDQ